MDHGVYIRTRFVNFAMDIAFEEQRRRGNFPADGIAVEIVFENVGGSDECGRKRTGHEVVPRVAVAADADVPIRIEDFVPRKDPVGGDQILNLIRLSEQLPRGTGHGRKAQSADEVSASGNHDP